ncbi:MAG: hypothetical protein IKZ99_02265 [Salinivirgaceae bacterium]|nr:hypothetical protein [Salinivirgaceae bacterium]
MSKLRYMFFCVALLWSGSACAVSAAVDSVFVRTERELLQVAHELSATRYKDLLQDSLSLKLKEIFAVALKRDGSLNYAFDSLKNDISIVTSPDGLVRILTWFSVDDAGNYRYTGFLQYHDKDAKKDRLFELVDCSETIENAENQTLAPQNWYGALYYGIVEKKVNGEPVYTLLAWDGCGLYTTRKLVETLTFTAKGQPRFGKSIIKVGRKKMKRLVFEYNKRATMMINYDANLDLIVLDHLAVLGSQDTSNPQFFGPDMSYDALKFENDMWVYQSNIEYKRPVVKGKKR